MGFDLYTRVIPTTTHATEMEPGYFRLNHRGMSAVVSMLDAMDLLDDDVARPELCEWPPQGMSETDAARLLPAFEQGRSRSAGGRGSGPMDPVLEQHLAILDRALGTRSPDPERVPAFKLADNRGWLVTAEECELLYTKILLKRIFGEVAPLGAELGLPAPALHLFEEFAEFNGRARELGGYQVW